MGSYVILKLETQSLLQLFFCSKVSFLVVFLNNNRPCRNLLKKRIIALFIFMSLNFLLLLNRWRFLTWRSFLADQTISSILMGESISISMDGEMNGNLNAVLIKRTKKTWKIELWYFTDTVYCIRCLLFFNISSSSSFMNLKWKLLKVRKTRIKKILIFFFMFNAILCGIECDE